MITPEEIIPIEEVNREQEEISDKAEKEIDTWLTKEFKSPTSYSQNFSSFSYTGKSFGLLTPKYKEQLIQKYKQGGWSVDTASASTTLYFSRKNLGE